MKVWVCKVCGYVHMGPEAPEECPQCHAPKSKFFEKVETPAAGKIVWADEHKVGVAQGLDAEVVQWQKLISASLSKKLNMLPSLQNSWAKSSMPIPRRTWNFALLPKREQLRVSLLLQSAPRNSVTMLSMTLFMKCARTRPVTALLSRACSVATSSKIGVWCGSGRLKSVRGRFFMECLRKRV